MEDQTRNRKTKRISIRYSKQSISCKCKSKTKSGILKSALHDFHVETKHLACILFQRGSTGMAPFVSSKYIWNYHAFFGYLQRYIKSLKHENTDHIYASHGGFDRLFVGWMLRNLKGGTKNGFLPP